MWQDYMDQLVLFAQTRLFNRLDRHGGYGPRGAYVGKAVSPDDIRRHFEGKKIIGAHAVNGVSGCRWIAFDIDRHDESIDPAQTWAAALAIDAECRGRGIVPLIEDSNGYGGYHVWAFFHPILPAAQAHDLAADIARAAGVRCETYPRQRETTYDQPGSWLRLPGKHHKRDHWSRFWTGADWGGPEILLSAPTNALSAPVAASAPTPAPTATPAPERADSALPDFEDTVSALASIPNTVEAWQTAGARSHYDLWFKVLASLALYNTPEAYAAARQWSESFPGYEGDEYFDTKWAELTQRKTKSRVTGKTLLNIAAKHFGWKPKNPFALVAPNAQSEGDPEPGSEPGSRYATTPAELAQIRADAIARLNQTYATIGLRNKSAILRECDGQIGFWDYNSFRNYHKADKIQTGIEPTRTGKPEFKCTADVWLEDRRHRAYKDFTFAPGVTLPADRFNLWRGWGVEPRPGDCSIFLDHLFATICCGNREHYDYLIAWMADAVQNPSEKTGVSVVLRGPQGAGKGLAINYFGDLFGQHYRVVTNPAHISGKFNAHLEDCLLLFADEAFNVLNKTAVGTLKALVTESHLLVERKGVDAQISRNMMRIIMASNNDWVVPADIDDRRFFVLDVSNNRVRDHEFFASLVNERNNGGREALFHYLLNHRSEINLRQAPKTKGLERQKIASLDSVPLFWYGRLMEGVVLRDHERWQIGFVSEYLYKFYEDDTRNLRDHTVQPRVWFFRDLNRYCRLVPVRWRDGNKRRTGYRVPGLNECRQQFEQALGQSIDWPEVEDDSGNEGADSDGRIEWGELSEG